MLRQTKRIHIVHIVYSFATGGLENGVVNLINRLPEDDYQHSIVCITSHDKNFYQRITSNNTDIFDLHKKPGKSIVWMVSCWRLLKKLSPDIVHSRNLNALEAQLPATLARVKYRIHGEHGWDQNDLGGVNKKFQWIRRLLKPLIHQYIALSKESVNYLTKTIKVSSLKVNHICNGVDTDLFFPNKNRELLPDNFRDKKSIIFGTVGRLAEVKNQTFLVDAFLQMWQSDNSLKDIIKLIIVGDGVLKSSLISKVVAVGAESAVFFTGNRSDVSQLIPQLDVFILPSLAEGISNTILEAMSSGLPVIATNVGGNPELIPRTLAQSHLVTVNNKDELIIAMSNYVISPEKIIDNGAFVRNYCVENFSLLSMVNRYHEIYQKNNKGL